MNPKRSTPKHITMEKLRILEMTKEKKVTSADTSAETLQARRKWHDIFKVPKEIKKKKLTTKSSLPGKVII